MRHFDVAELTDRSGPVAAGLDYEINLKAEIEIMALHEKLDRILIDNLDRIARTQQEQLQRLTELCEMLAANGPE